MESSIDIPFYFKPPWNILFDQDLLEKVNPWNVNLSFLLLSFLKEMENDVKVDFRASGMALDSSATIHLMKSELLLKLEEPPQIPKPHTKMDFIPPALILPLRYELTTTTVQNLFEALDNALKMGEKPIFKKPSEQNLLPPAEIVPEVSIYLMEMEAQMEELLKRIRNILNINEIVTLSKVVNNLDIMERIRDFILLLFLAHKNKVILWQEENSDEVIITMKGD